MQQGQQQLLPEENIDAIDSYGINLTDLAKQGKIDPVIGRENEIRRIVQILSRRTKNNPVLIGEPARGKRQSLRDSRKESLREMFQKTCSINN